MTPIQLFVGVTTAYINREERAVAAMLDDATRTELRLALIAGAGAMHGTCALAGFDTAELLQRIAPLPMPEALQ